MLVVVGVPLQIVVPTKLQLKLQLDKSWDM